MSEQKLESPVELYSAEECKQLLANHEEVTANNCRTCCWIVTNSITNDKGYRVLAKHPKKNKQTSSNLLCHLVALRAANLPLPQQGYQASHLCHNPECANPDHIVVESVQANQSRKGCCGPEVPVFFEEDNTQFLLLIDMCSHEPKCLASKIPEGVSKYEIERL